MNGGDRMKQINSIGNLSKNSAVSNLSPEEVKYICEKITIEKLKQYLKKRNYILSGFRPDKMSDSQLVDHIINNIKNPVIGNLLNNYVDPWIREIQEKITKLEKNGVSTGEALIKTIRESTFCDNSKLYFKLSNLSNIDKYVELFCDALSYVNSMEDSKKLEMEKREDQSKLLDEINKLNNQISDYSKDNQKLEEELKRTRSELAKYEYLEKYADSEMKQNDNSKFQYTSIGKIIRIENTLWIERLADIKNSEIRPFVFDTSRPYYFNNRNRIYRKDGPDTVGAISVWNWSSIPVSSDKDKTESEYNKNTRFIEVVELCRCSSLDDLSEELSQGVEKTFISEKVLFVHTSDNGNVEGLLCLPNDLEIIGNKAKISKSVVKLRHYTLRMEDIINIDGIRVFRKISLGRPESLYHVRKPCDVVKDKLIARISFREGFTKSDIKTIKNYLKNFLPETLVQEVANAYGCSEEQATEYVNNFTNNVHKYLDSSDLDMNIISFALEKNANLVERCKEQISKEWKQENEKKINEELERLKDIESTKNSIKKDVSILENNKKNLVSQIEKIKSEISKKEKLAEDVEKQIDKRICDARQNAADFISQMAFVPSVSISSSDTKHLPIFMSTIQSEFMGSDIEDLDDFENELHENFVISGYEDGIATNMAYAISFSICNRIPVIIRENSTEISRCVASLINADGLYEVFVPIEGISIEQLFETIFVYETDQPRVFLIHGVFDGYNLNIFNALVNRLKNHKGNIFVFLSIEGLSVKMLPPDVWNRAFYVDGDEGLKNLVKGKTHSFNVTIEYKYSSIDNEDFRRKKEKLSAFSKVIGYMQMNLYAMYLSCFKVDLDKCDTILNQIIANACSSDSEELLQSLFNENGISRGEELLSKIL